VRLQLTDREINDHPLFVLCHWSFLRGECPARVRLSLRHPCQKPFSRLAYSWVLIVSGSVDRLDRLHYSSVGGSRSM
jgi:hypothetical protein